MDNKLGIQDLASAFAERYGMDMKSSTVFVKTVFDIVEDYIAKDKLVKIKGFGTFKLISVSDRESINVNTGERIVIAGHSKLTFTPDSALKDAVNRPFADFETTPLNEATPIEAMERMSEGDSAHADDEDNDSGDLYAASLSDSDDEISAGADDSDEVTEVQVPESHDTKAEPVGSVVDLADDMVNEGEHADVGNAVDMDCCVDQERASFEDASDEEPIGNDNLSDKDTNPSYPMAAETLEKSDCTDGRSCFRWLYVLLTLLLMALSYVCGCYRVHDMLDIALYSDDASESGNLKPALPDNEEGKLMQEMDSIVCDTICRDTLSLGGDIVSDGEAAVPEESPEELAKYFPQVPNGEYWIVGDAGRVHTMQVGETLYRIAKKELGDRELIQYLIVFNKFANPDIIHKGDTIRIPKLMKKQGTVSDNSNTRK
ncbi:MAG: HU family DNA-binding protein [Bacteroidaceae bacterium]|nr:HU family DNA-binding protein [Bacteroidaceae bacterium]